MAQIILGGKIVLNLGTDLDPMFTELYAAASGNFSGVTAMNIGMSGGTRRLNVGGTANVSAVLKSTSASGVAGSSAWYFGNSASDTVGFVNYDHAANYMAFGVGGTERVRIDSSGNTGFGANPGAYRIDAVSTTGIRILGGALRLVDTGSTTGASITPLPAGGGLTISTDGTNMQFAPGGTNRLLLGIGGQVRPGTDNSQALGDGALRWSTVYAGTGTINTSDAREKTTVRSLSAAELAAAAALAKEFGAYRFLAAVELKGEQAREHIGMTVQRAIQIMEQHELDPMRYGFICYDEWEEVRTPARVEERSEETGLRDADGQPMVRTYEVEVEPEKVTPAGNRFSFRPDELLMFIARGFEARLSALEVA